MPSLNLVPQICCVLAAAPASSLSPSADLWSAIDARLRSALCPEYGQLVAGDWLAPGQARVFDLTGIVNGPKDPLARIHEALDELPVDWAWNPDGLQPARAFVSDMDSTIIGQECLDELADFAGKKAEVSAITERAMAGELDFEGALTQRVRMLAGLPAEMLERCYAQRIKLQPGARTLLATLRAQDVCTALVSGGFTFFTARVAADAGFEHHRANTLIIKDGLLTGEVARPILGRAAKLAALQDYCAQTWVGLKQAIAIGDGANDLDMITAAGLGIAYMAKPIVASQAPARIISGDLTSVLYFQGIAKADWVNQ